MKQIFTLCLFTLSFSALFAQPGDRGEQLERLRIAFITEELDLTPEEAQVFWPVFNEFTDQRKEIHRSSKRKGKQLEKNTDPTSADVIDAMETRSAALRKEAELLDTYVPRFLDAVGPAKTAKLLQVEEKFKRKVLKRLDERRDRN